MFLGSLSRHNKDLKRRTLKPSARHSSWVLDKPCYSSILFRRQQESERERKERTHAGERVPERALWLLLLYVFFLHLGLPYANWAQPGVLFVLPEVFTLVLGPPFDLPCLLATTILDSFSLFYLPNRRTRFLHTPCKSGRCCERASSVIRNHQSGLSFRKLTWAPVSSTVKGKSIFTLTFYPDRSKMLINCENNWMICFLNIFLF